MNNKNKQVIWTLFVFQAAFLTATAKFSKYYIQEPVSSSKYNHHTKFIFNSDPIPSSHLHSLYEDDSAEPRYGRNFGFAPLPIKTHHGVTPEHLSLFAKVDHNKFPTSSSFITPKKSYYKGLKDPIHSSSIIYERPSYKASSKKNILSTSDDSYGKPSYEEIPSYEESPLSHSSSASYSPYSKAHSHRSYISIPTEPYLPPTFDPADYTFPPYPPLPSFSKPANAPHSEHEARNQVIGSYTYKDFPPFLYENPEQYPVSKSQRPSYDAEEEDEESDIEYPSEPPKSRPSYYKHKKYYDTEEMRKPETRFEDRESKRHRGQYKEERLGKPYGRPSPVSIPQLSSQEVDNEEEGEKEDNPNTISKDGGPEEEAEDEDEEAPPAYPQGSHHKQPNRISVAGHRRRCIKKQKDLSIDEVNGKPGRQMMCLVCENLDTRGTYETCNYKSAPKRKKYYSHEEEEDAGEERQTQKTVSRTKRYSGDNDFESESENFEDEDDDFLTEYKPSLPAYANDDSCVEVKKNGASCMVCLNPETNGKYKQCSYATEPEEDSYEFAQSSQYGSANKNTGPSKLRYARQTFTITNSTSSQPSNSSSSANKGQVKDKIIEGWQKLSETEQKKIQSVNKMFQTLARTKREQPSFRFFTDLEDSSYEKYFLDIFPELNAEEDLLSEQRSSLLNNLDNKSLLSKSDGFGSLEKNKKLGSYFKDRKSLLSSDEGDGMNKMMEEFVSKDRSACTKQMKDKMTCYLCNDSDGIKREECMYVVENEPKKVTYQQSSQTSDSDGKSLKREITDDTGVSQSTPQLQQYTRLSHSPQMYSNVQITYTQEHSPTTTIFKRYAKFADAAADESYNEKDTKTLL